MNIGRLDRQITIQTATQTTDAWNHPTDTWSTLATVWATRTDRRSAEVVETAQVTGLTTTDWTIRYLSGVTHDARIIGDDGHTYEIRGIQEIGRREGLRIITEIRT